MFNRASDRWILASGAILIGLLFDEEYHFLPHNADWVALGAAAALLVVSFTYFLKGE